MKRADRPQERLEALQSAEAALARLNSADMLVRSSGRWGWLEHLCGGTIALLLRHGELQDVRRALQAADKADVEFDVRMREAGYVLPERLPSLTETLPAGLHEGEPLRSLIAHTLSEITQARRIIESGRNRLISELQE